jgi:chromosome segregation ATPase
LRQELREFGEMGLWQSELDERAADIEKKAKEIDDVLNEIKILHGVIENTENGFRKKLKEKNEKIKSLNRKFGDLEKGFLAKNSDIEAMIREFSNTEDSLRFQLTQLEIQNLELQTRLHHPPQYTNYNSPPYPGQSPFTQNHLNIQHSPIEEDE